MSDDEAIRHILALHAQRLDDQQTDAYTDMYTENGRFIWSEGQYDGKAAIREFIRGLFAGDSLTARSKHVVANSVIDIHGAEAKVVSDVVVYSRDGLAPWSILVVNRHHDRLLKQNGTWLVAEKRLERI